MLQASLPKRKRKRKYVSKTGLTREQWKAIFAEAARACGPTVGQCMRNAIAEAKRRYGVPA